MRIEKDKEQFNLFPECVEDQEFIEVLMIGHQFEVNRVEKYVGSKYKKVYCYELRER